MKALEFLKKFEASKWRMRVAYGAFFVVALVFFLFLTFPFDIVEERLVAEAAKQGYVLTVGTMGPAFMGVTAQAVEIAKPPVPGEDKLPGSLPIDKLTLRPALFPPGVSFNAKLMGGTVSGSVGGVNTVALNIVADKVALDDPRLRALAGVDLAGTLDLDIDLDIPLVPATRAGKKLIDPSAADGHIEFALNGARIDGGKITLTLPMMGNVPQDVPINKVALGDVKARMNFEKGQGTLETFTGRGDDLELAGSGTLRLGKSFGDSAPLLDLKVKADDATRNRMGMLGIALSTLPKDTENSAFRIARLGGTFRRIDMRKR